MSPDVYPTGTVGVAYRARCARSGELPMNILVTGAAGFIGSHLSEHLVTGGTVEDRLSEGPIDPL